MAARLDHLWADYEQHHRSRGNQWCHMIGIPLIIAGLLGLLAVPVFQIQQVPVEAALLLILASGIAYLWLDVRLGAVMLAATLLIYLGARLLSWPVALGLFLAGWVFQFIGHGVYEKRSPAFFHNVTHLLVGPLWVVNHLVPVRPRAEAGAAPGLKS